MDASFEMSFFVFILFLLYLLIVILYTKIVNRFLMNLKRKIFNVITQNVIDVQHDNYYKYEIHGFHFTCNEWTNKSCLFVTYLCQDRVRFGVMPPGLLEGARWRRCARMCSSRTRTGLHRSATKPAWVMRAQIGPAAPGARAPTSTTPGIPRRTVVGAR